MLESILDHKYANFFDEVFAYVGFEGKRNEIATSTQRDSLNDFPFSVGSKGLFLIVTIRVG